jgi:hypothetical protein
MRVSIPGWQTESTSVCCLLESQHFNLQFSQSCVNQIVSLINKVIRHSRNSTITGSLPGSVSLSDYATWLWCSIVLFIFHKWRDKLLKLMGTLLVLIHVFTHFIQAPQVLEKWNWAFHTIICYFDTTEFTCTICMGSATPWPCW